MNIALSKFKKVKQTNYSSARALWWLVEAMLEYVLKFPVSPPSQKFPH